MNNDVFALAMGINRQDYLNFYCRHTFSQIGSSVNFSRKAYFEKIEFFLRGQKIRAFETLTTSNKTLPFCKILLGATYNLFILSPFTPVFSVENGLNATIAQNKIQDQYHTWSTTEKKHNCSNTHDVNWRLTNETKRKNSEIKFTKRSGDKEPIFTPIESLT